MRIENERIVLQYHGQQPGPLLLIFGSVHGNEPAGVEALKIVEKLLEQEPEKNPDFNYCGQVYGLIGNRRAYAQKQRFIDLDLNRAWTTKRVERLLSGEAPEIQEEYEILEILTLIDQIVEKCQPESILVLDLHTTSADGGLFSIASGDPTSIGIGVNLHAPVVLGILEGVRGTLMDFLNTQYFNMPTTALTFESGQHQDPESVTRAVSAIINFMRSTACVYPQDVESRHDDILRRDTAYLPRLTELVYAHKIKPGDMFRMRPGYRNFQSVANGELLANDINGPIYSQSDGIILMPLYQKKGEDGFFIIREYV